METSAESQSLSTLSQCRPLLSSATVQMIADHAWRKNNTITLLFTMLQICRLTRSPLASTIIMQKCFFDTDIQVLKIVRLGTSRQTDYLKNEELRNYPLFHMHLMRHKDRYKNGFIFPDRERKE